MVGAPFSWHEFRGGLELDFLGFWLDYARFEVGLSEKRTQWLIHWLDGLKGDKPVLIRQVIEGLGRLAFAVRMLTWLKPFLSPLYAWVGAIPSSAILKPPLMIMLVSTFLKRNLQTKLYRIPCRRPIEDKGEWFRTDAKGAAGFAVLGGWECSGLCPKEARWFSLRLKQEQIPWAFKNGDSAWASTSLEVLAATVALKLFSGNVHLKDGRRQANYVVNAGTDNQAAEALSLKRSTTKTPLMLVMMQLADISSSLGTLLKLHWRPRLENQPADDLTNERFEQFNPSLRIDVTWESLGFTTLDVLTKTLEEFEAQRITHKPGALTSLRSTKRKFDKSNW